MLLISDEIAHYTTRRSVVDNYLRNHNNKSYTLNQFIDITDISIYDKVIILSQWIDRHDFFTSTLIFNDVKNFPIDQRTALYGYLTSEQILSIILKYYK